MHKLVFYLCCALTIPLSGQHAGALSKQAEKAFAKGNINEAAALFERAGRLKEGNLSLMNRAGEAYFQIRDYINAANCFQVVAMQPKYPFAGLRYARCLKQQARYEPAQTAFESVRSNYAGPQMEVMLHVVKNELAGCALAERFHQTFDSANVRCASQIPAPVTTPEHEWSPLPFSDTLMYFFRTGENQNMLMRSTRKNGIWQIPVQASGLPESASKGFLSGTFSADAQRFYFVRTEEQLEARKGGFDQIKGGVLYALQRNAEGEWGDPTRLRDYINLKGSACLWPYVCQFDGEEWLFFASNRPGGAGGFDLYCCKRPLNSDEFDFSFPLNLGEKINTGADEVTPFYDIFNQQLWFSSMGHPSLGGVDVFFADGISNQWSAVQNAGLDINSTADDYFFVLKKDGSGAFLVSNRKVEGTKNSTLDDDLFEVLFPKQED
ncbi:MAG: tetratricopeptide repeat protein [Saprospiraceae bacterium]|nr:tetratricopeptide repeat protein [Saprospiraceae bacterium]